MYRNLKKIMNSQNFQMIETNDANDLFKTCAE